MVFYLCMNMCAHILFPIPFCSVCSPLWSSQYHYYSSCFCLVSSLDIHFFFFFVSFNLSFEVVSVLLPFTISHCQRSSHLFFIFLTRMHLSMNLFACRFVNCFIWLLHHLGAFVICCNVQCAFISHSIPHNATTCVFSSYYDFGARYVSLLIVCFISHITAFHNGSVTLPNFLFEYNINAIQIFVSLRIFINSFCFVLKYLLTCLLKQLICLMRLA